jgi:hypothetical protein
VFIRRQSVDCAVLLGVESRLVDEHDWNVVAHWIQSPTLGALKGFVLFHERSLANGADKNLEQSFVDHFGNFTPNRNRRVTFV